MPTVGFIINRSINNILKFIIDDFIKPNSFSILIGFIISLLYFGYLSLDAPMILTGADLGKQITGFNNNAIHVTSFDNTVQAEIINILTYFIISYMKNIYWILLFIFDCTIIQIICRFISNIQIKKE